MGRRTPGGKPSGKTYFLKCMFTKNVFFSLQTVFFDVSNVLMSFLAEI